jgi:glycosyltransferase involved in cell wall biosynthesis
MENLNAKKKIVLIGPAHPLRGGLASYNERLARAFQEAGHSITLFTFSLQYPGFLFPGTTQYSSEPAPTDLDIRVVINSVAPWNWLKIGKEIRQMKPDLVVVRYWLPFMGPCLGTILRLVKKNKQTRIVCIADNIIPHEKRPGDEWFTRYFVKPVDAFITMSEKVLGDMPLFAPHKPARYVPHPLYDNFGEPISVQAARQQLGIDESANIVLFFGFIRKYKGLDLLFDAIHLLNERHPGHPYRFLIAGEFYEDQKPYEEQIDRLQIREQLILHTDFIPDSAVKYYLCTADVVIQPYRSATQSGVTPLAYHFEVPMIVTRVGGLPALVPEGKVGLVAEPDAESLADSIEQYFKLGKQHFLPGLREEKKQYRWEVMVEALMRI